MPPKSIFTKEQVVEAGFSIVRSDGMQALSARSLAQRLGTSTKPVFGLFSSMQEVQEAVLASAEDYYQSFIDNAMTVSRENPYKASGLAYIQFARQENILFKLLFMRDRRGEDIQEHREDVRPLLNLIRKNLHISEEDAYRFHLEMWIYVHGFATMIATDYLPWDEHFISQSLTDVYQGLCLRYQLRWSTQSTITIGGVK